MHNYYHIVHIMFSQLDYLLVQNFAAIFLTVRESQIHIDRETDRQTEYESKSCYLGL